jgi:hypothetical protein
MRSTAWALGLLMCAPLAQAAGCPPPGHDVASLEALKAKQFEIADAAARQQLALALLPCLADADPTLRDGIGFEAYAHWLRGDKLDAATRTELLVRLGTMLRPAPADSGGFRQPFAALVLSEVARTDRIAPWMSGAQRGTLVAAAASYLASVRDYRGFDDREGWRHGVAHGSDLVLQLGLNPALDRAALDTLLDAIALQVVPETAHAYVDGESERLARAVLYIAQRGLHDEAEWQAWLERVAAPAPLADWNQAFRSRAGLAQRHDVVAFVFALYVNVRENEDANMQRLLPGLRAVMKTLP